MLTKEEQELKDQIISILNLTEDEFNNTPAEKIFQMLKEKSSQIKSN